jgi:hypothetical protein
MSIILGHIIGLQVSFLFESPRKLENGDEFISLPEILIWMDLINVSKTLPEGFTCCSYMDQAHMGKIEMSLLYGKVRWFSLNIFFNFTFL